ncbi:uncharacterized protein BXZ73DRAFT_40772 [Epithele typhae]|uniref:uncharacterized protein n=1 Tax=Epithele typhae TaxID=378194 RepID=UPI0020078F3F|nr:uncharacterized protein BXZ73DRAFT_40772 [Epithele typhae]KAH9943196.1 hypothetical protein BXZ73DRAFT_40772 [Epithele typhae]
MAGLRVPHSPWRALPLLLLLTCFTSLFSRATAQPAVLQFSDCFSDANTTQKLSVSTVYAQFFPESASGAYLSLTVIGTNPETIISSSDGPNPVATTLFTTTELLTFQEPVANSSSFFCEALRSTNASQVPANSTAFCPFAPGPYAFSSAVQIAPGYELATYDTRLRALDPFQNELLCLDVNTTMLIPGPVNSVYGHAHIIFWCTVALALGYWIVVGVARIVAAWGRGSATAGNGVLARIDSVGFVMASALSGEKFASAPALMRFCTPSMRDIIFHTQWCAALSMVAVQWPMFAYPILSQAAWSTLAFNITITQGKNSDQFHWNPLAVPSFDPPSNFAAQLTNPSSGIYVNSDAPNLIFQLPDNATSGMSSFAYSVGLRPQDLFPISMSLFLAILAATIVLSVLVSAMDWLLSVFSDPNAGAPPAAGLGGSRSPRYSSASKDVLDGVGNNVTVDENRSLNGHFLFSRSARLPTGRSWWRSRGNFASFHGSALQGNLIRVLMLFHLPITIFSCYHLSLHGQVSTTSLALAALSFASLSVLLPALLVLRLTFTRTSKLYDETWTLLSLGPLYNHYRHGSQLFACTLFAINIAFGVTIGFGQRSGTAQAVIILVVEVAAALGTSIWLPWGQGASMGLISFLFCVGRIVIAVLLVILTPVVSIGPGPAQWVAYAILFILGLVYLAFFLMLVMKILEAVLRIAGGIGFTKSRHVVDSGLLGTMGLMGCCGPRQRRRSSRGYRPTSNRQPSSLALSKPQPPFKDHTPPSSGPPSVLRPEHAMQPYKEDSDDEGGFIMAAWHEERASPAPEAPKSGFSRVAGGRANFDTPYAIASGSQQTFPSVEQRAPGSSAFAHADDSPPGTPSMVGSGRALPAGAMPPSHAHTRTKSQTAVIEVLAPEAQAGLNAAAVAAATPPKKKFWYNRKKNRRLSESDVALDSSPAAPPPAEDAGRSFVVVRKGRQGVPSQNSATSAPMGGPADEHGRRSFTVLRGPAQSSSSTPHP